MESPNPNCVTTLIHTVKALKNTRLVFPGDTAPFVGYQNLFRIRQFQREDFDLFTSDTIFDGTIELKR